MVWNLPYAAIHSRLAHCAPQVQAPQPRKMVVLILHCLPFWRAPESTGRATLGVWRQLSSVQLQFQHACFCQFKCCITYIHQPLSLHCRTSGRPFATGVRPGAHSTVALEGIRPRDVPFCLAAQVCAPGTLCISLWLLACQSCKALSKVLGKALCIWKHSSVSAQSGALLCAISIAALWSCWRSSVHRARPSYHR